MIRSRRADPAFLRRVECVFAESENNHHNDIRLLKQVDGTADCFIKLRFSTGSRWWSANYRSRKEKETCFDDFHAF